MKGFPSFQLWAAREGRENHHTADLVVGAAQTFLLGYGHEVGELRCYGQ